MSRKKIIVGNWKMNNTIAEGISFVNSIKEDICENNVDVAFCPSYILIDKMVDALKGTDIKVGAQNVHFEIKGAYTGEVSIDMLKELGITYCIIGHSERRQYFNETDETVNLKLKRIFESSSISPIICVGEGLEIREKDKHFDLVKSQVVKAFEGVNNNNVKRSIIAYEPIWAIGTGKTATSNQAEEMCLFIRNVIKEIYNEDVSESIRIQYGGSVNGENAKELLNMPNIDGALVGGASLKPEFVNIVRGCR